MPDSKQKLLVRTGNPPVEQYYTYDETRLLVLSQVEQARYRSAAELSAALALHFESDVDALILAAETYILVGDPARSLDYAQRAVSLDEGSARATFQLSKSALLVNDFHQALDSINKAIAISPGEAQYFYQRGCVWVAKGDREQALDDFSTALRLDPKDMNSLLELSQIPSFACSRAMVKKIEFMIASRQLTNMPCAAAHFALANLYAREGEIAKQCEHLEAGNRLFGRTSGYDPERTEKLTRETRKLFPPSLFGAAGKVQGRPNRLVFIVGMPRSGSTLVEQILLSHSKVRTVSENSHLLNAISEFSTLHAEGTQFPAFVDEASLPRLHHIADHYLESVHSRDDGGVIVDKTLGNYLFWGLIQLLFPNARIVHTRRHPVATCFSCYQQRFAPGAVQYGYDLEYLARQYRLSDELIQYWKQTLPEGWITVDYEKMVADQRTESQRLLQFLDLPWEEQCLRFYDNDSSVATSSKLQVKQGIYTAALDRWKDYADYLGPLLPLQTLYERADQRR